MLTCRPPYGHLESFAAMFKIATEPMCCNLPAKCSSHTRDFLSQCFIRYLLYVAIIWPWYVENIPYKDYIHMMDVTICYVHTCKQ